MKFHWIPCVSCRRESCSLNGDGECELCVTMRVMAPVIAAINAGMEKTNNKRGGGR